MGITITNRIVLVLLYKCTITVLVLDNRKIYKL